MSYTKTFTNTEYSQAVITRNGTTVLSLAQNFPVTGTRTGQSVKDWREKIRTGQNAGSDYYSDRNEFTRFTPGSGSCSGSSGGVSPTLRTETITGFFQATPIPSLVHLSPATNEATATALQKIYAKIRSEYQNLNSAAVVAEGLSVVRQFGAPASAILELTNRRINRLYLEGRGLKGSVAFRRLKFAEIVASTWLEYSFGLRPLISDTVAVAESLARWQEEADGYSGRLRSRVSARGASEMRVVENTPAQNPNASTLWRYHRRSVTETQYRVQYVCGLNSSHLADAGSNDRLLQILGFSPENWVPGIWEWVPWSWLADYFFNIGQILQAGVTSTAGVSWVCKTVSQETFKQTSNPVDVETTFARLASNGFTVGRTATGHIGEYTQRRNTLTRTASATLGIPPLTVSVPTEYKKLANMAAVLLARKRDSSAALWLF